MTITTSTIMAIGFVIS